MNNFIKCSECGKFCQIADRGTYHGDIMSTEPPDEELFCKKCAKKLEKYYIKKEIVPVYWLEPHWVINVAKKLGYL